MNRSHLYSFLAGALAVFLVMGWPSGEELSAKSEVAPLAQELATKAAVKRACTTVTAYPDEVKKDLDLPKAVVKDKTRVVLTATQVHAARHAHTVSAVFDTDTGETQPFVRHDPLPWLASERRLKLGVAYGYDSDHGMLTQVSARYEFMQIKVFSVGLVGTMDDAGGKSGGVELSAEF